MKRNRNGQAAILASEQITQLFADGFTSDRDRALFGICLYCGCRISEALALTADDICGGIITFRKATTKGKIGTRQVDVHPTLQALLTAYGRESGALFPGRHGRGMMSRVAADQILRAACDRIGLEGVSTHSFRRTALTAMSNAGIPLRVIQEISGHTSLNELQRYLEVQPAQKQAAINSLFFRCE